MQKLAGVTLEKDTSGRIKKVTLDMKYHAAFVDDYLDRLKIEEGKKRGDYVKWEDVKTALDKKHGVSKKPLQNNIRTQGRKTA